MMFNLQQRKWDLFVDWFDSWAIHEDSLSLILLIELNSLFSLVYFMRMSWFSWSIWTVRT